MLLHLRNQDVSSYPAPIRINEKTLKNKLKYLEQIREKVPMLTFVLDCSLYYEIAALQISSVLELSDNFEHKGTKCVQKGERYF